MPPDPFSLLRGSGKPWIFVQTAVLIAGSSDEMQEVLGWLVGRSKPKVALPPTPSHDVWMSMYRGHRKMANALVMDMLAPLEVSATDVIDSFSVLSRMSPEEIRPEVESLSRVKQEAILRPLIGVPFPPSDDNLKLMLQAVEAEDEADSEGFEQLLVDPVGQYFFRVWLPCWMIYRELPPFLLRRARSGEPDALDKLLRLDKSLVTDPVIARRIHEVTHNGSKRDQDLVLNAIRGMPKAKLDAKAVRYGLAGLISQLAKVCKCRVTAPEIARLFDGIERIRTGRASDRHIPAGEAFTKAIQRNRNWPGADLPKPDK